MWSELVLSFRKVAIDASMSLYQILTAARQEAGGGAQQTSENGEITSLLIGMFYLAIRMVENGIKPVFVFDGKPPRMKDGELERRKDKRDEAKAALEKAEEEGDMEEVDKQKRRLVKVTSDHVAEVQACVVTSKLHIKPLYAPGEDPIEALGHPLC